MYISVPCRAEYKQIVRIQHDQFRPRISNLDFHHEANSIIIMITGQNMERPYEHYKSNRKGFTLFHPKRHLPFSGSGRSPLPVA